MSTHRDRVERRRESVRTGLTADSLRLAVLDNLAYMQARSPDVATPHDWYMALAYSVRDRLLARWVETASSYTRRDVKVACYLSAEFLIGPQLGNNLVNLGIETAAREAMQALGQDLDALTALEEEPGLGNGGLGRLAACYLDSLATLQMPAIGYGTPLRVRHLRSGNPRRLAGRESPTSGCRQGNPWELVHPDISFYVNFGGHTETYTDEQGRHRVRWQPAREVKGVACDTPVLGLSRQHLQHAASVEERSGRVVRLPGLQRRRLLRRRPGEGDLRNAVQGALSER